jgi:hypothetical protein
MLRIVIRDNKRPAAKVTIVRSDTRQQIAQCYVAGAELPFLLNVLKHGAERLGETVTIIDHLNRETVTDGVQQ